MKSCIFVFTTIIASNYVLPLDQDKRQALEKLLPSNKFCGLQHSDDYFTTLNSTVVSEFPWLAIIKCQLVSGNYIIDFCCTGTLISRRYVLTTGRCYRARQAKPIRVVLGEYHLKNETDCIEEDGITECTDPLQEFGIEKIIESYAPFDQYYGGWVNEITLLRLDNTVTFFSDYIRPICLLTPEELKPKVGDILVASGWDDIKKRVNTTVLPNEECRKQIDPIRVAILDLELLKNGHLCTVAVNNTKVCDLSRGNPIIVSKKNQWFQVGIIASTFKCNSSWPQLHVNVDKYLDWIAENLEP